MAGSVLVVKLPKVYRASTLILIQQQRVPEEFVRSIISTDIDSRINTISQQINSRSNLENIIKQFKIFEDSETTGMFLEDKIELMRSWISVDLIRQDRRGPAEAFSISFKGKDPQKVMQVTNALARFVIDENLKVREAQALGTSDFLDDELKEIRLKLEKQESALESYRAQNMGGLPEQLQTNLRILEGLQQQINMKNENMRYAKNNLIIIQRQIDSENQDEEEPNQDQEAESADRSISEDEVLLNQMKAALSQLQLSYTDQHPDIIKLKASIQEQEKKIAQMPASPVTETRRQAPPDPIQQRRLEDRLNLQLERDELRLQIQTLENEIREIEAQVQFYQRMIESTPKREQELLSLNRDYENIKNIYDSMLSRKLESDIAVNMEKKQKGEQFRILDAAKVPMRPSEPDMKKLFVMVLGAGIGLGAGLIFLWEYLDTSFRKPDDLEAMLELPILCTVPTLIHARQKRKKLLGNIAFVFCMGAAVVLFAGFSVLTFKGTEKTLEFIRQYINV